MATQTATTRNLTTTLLMAVSRLQDEMGSAQIADISFRLGIVTTTRGVVLLQATKQGFTLERAVDPLKDDMGGALRNLITELRQSNG